MSMKFKVDYAFVPFTITEDYAPKGNLTGYFTKKAQMPGAALLTLPTVVVDVVPSATGDTYDSMTLYSCIHPLNAAEVISFLIRDLMELMNFYMLKVTELIFATRSPTIDATTLAKMEATARAAGVTWENRSLHQVDHSKCKKATQ
jgi:hypothetical protein